MTWVIKHNDTGKYVARPGSKSSYTPRLERARTWSTKEQAERERCVGNETVVSVSALMS